MRDMFLRWKYVVACAIVLSVVVTADARDGTLVRTPDADARPRIAAAEREARERTLPRIIRRVIKSLTDALTGPRP